MIYLYGGGGHAKVIIDILSSNGQKVAGIFDDDINAKLWNMPVYVFPGPFSEQDQMIISIGNNDVREKLDRKLQASFINAIHAKAIVSSSAKISEGTVVMANAVINADAFIGRHCIINTSAVVEHDCMIDEYVHISPNATLCGGVTVGARSQVGANAVVIPGKKIGSDTIIGAGAVVVNDIPDNVIAVGNPARVIKMRTDYGKNLSLAAAYGRR
jgi:sugar O-acyltransferase (sialic acid O-acetyltransferase NeuD family)